MISPRALAIMGRLKQGSDAASLGRPNLHRLVWKAGQDPRWQPGRQVEDPVVVRGLLDEGLACPYWVGQTCYIRLTPAGYKEAG